MLAVTQQALAKPFQAAQTGQPAQTFFHACDDVQDADVTADTVASTPSDLIVLGPLVLPTASPNSSSIERGKCTPCNPLDFAFVPGVTQPIFEVGVAEWRDVHADMSDHRTKAMPRPPNSSV